MIKSVLATSLLLLAACASAQNAPPLAAAGSPVGHVPVSGPAGAGTVAPFVPPGGGPPPTAPAITAPTNPAITPPPPPAQPAPGDPIQIVSDPNPPFNTGITRGINLDNVENNANWANRVPNAAEWAVLAGMGLTTVRIPIDPAFAAPGLLIGLPANPPTFSTSATVATHMAALDSIMALGASHGFNFILCIQPQANQKALADPDSEALVLTATSALSAHVATLPYTSSQVYMQAINEPHYSTTTWNTFGPQIVAAIRASLPTNPIIYSVAGANGAANFGALTLISDPYIIYDMHIYQPVTLTQMGTPGYKVNLSYLFPAPAGTTPHGGVTVPQTPWTDADLDANFVPGIAWAIAHNVPLIVTEIGATNKSDPSSRLAWLTRVKATLEANNVPWLLWSYSSSTFGLQGLNKGNLTDVLDPVLVSILSN